MAFYYVVFGVLASLAALLQFSSNSSGSGSDVGSKEFKKLRNNYIVVYSLMMAGDWLQGPYVYALYEHYGFTVKDIGRLFIMGFGSSMIFGTIVGSLADKHGRKKAGLLYVAAYALSCVTKHSSSYQVLAFGRLLGGIATSLLFSAFEAWLVAAHNSAGFQEAWLGDTFSKAVFAGNGLMAIVAGLAGNYLVENMALGPVAPFDAAIVVLLAGGAIIAATWSENYGDSSSSQSLGEQFADAYRLIRKDQRIALLGAMQSLFEASMYTFVFLWTPALSPHGEKIPHGFIFANFMTASMAGSSLSGLLMKRFKIEAYMPAVFWASAASLFVPVLYHTTAAADDGTAWLSESVDVGLSLEGKVQMAAFCVFELCVGVFWPSMMTMRAHYIPEDVRATIINCFRIPLNLFVCIILYNVHQFPLAVMFGLCAAFLCVAALCQQRLQRIAHCAPGGAAAAADDPEPAFDREAEYQQLLHEKAAAH